VPEVKKFKVLMKKNKNLRLMLFKQKSEIESQKIEKLNLMQTTNQLESKIQELESGENVQEKQKEILKLKQKYKNLDRLFTKEKDEALRLKRENTKLMKILKKGKSLSNIEEFGDFQSLEDIDHSTNIKTSEKIHTLKTEIKSLKELNFQLRRDHEFRFGHENINYSNRREMLPQIRSIHSYKK
jgi:hypothetical protein